MKPQLALFGVGICWSFTPVFVVLASWNSYGTVMARALLTGFALVAFAYVQSGEQRIDMRFLPRAFFGGICGALSTSLFAVAFLFAEAGKVYVFYYTFPVLLMLFDGYASSRKISVSELFVLALSFCGVSVVYSNELSSFQLGIGELMAFGSALCWVLHIIVIRGVSNRQNICLGNALGQLLIAACFLPAVVIKAELPSGAQCVFLAALGAFSFLALYLWGIGVRDVPGHLAGTITMLEAPGGVLLMVFFKKSTLPLSSVVGGVLVLLAAALAVRLSVLHSERTR